MLKLSATGMAIAVVSVIAIVIAILGGYVFRWYSAPFIGQLEERELTNRGAYRIQGYEQFYRWFEELDAIKVKLQHYTNRELDLRERTECTALLNQHANLVADYNAASRAERTQGQWRAADLPPTLQHEGLPSCSN